MFHFEGGFADCADFGRNLQGVTSSQSFYLNC